MAIIINEGLCEERRKLNLADKGGERQYSRRSRPFNTTVLSTTAVQTKFKKVSGETRSQSLIRILVLANPLSPNSQIQANAFSMMMCG